MAEVRRLPEDFQSDRGGSWDSLSPKRDYDLIEQVLARVTEHPEQHDQGLWIGDLVAYVEPDDDTPMVEVDGYVANVVEPYCGTTACVAGWAILLADEPLAWDPSVWNIQARRDGNWVPASGESWDKAAARLMGLTRVERGHIFSDNRQGAMRRLSEILAERKEDL